MTAKTLEDKLYGICQHAKYVTENVDALCHALADFTFDLPGSVQHIPEMDLASEALDLMWEVQRRLWGRTGREAERKLDEAYRSKLCNHVGEAVAACEARRNGA